MVTGDKAYITTGENGSLNTFTWVYDFVTDLWFEKTPFAGSARTGAIGFTLQNRGYAGLGGNGSSFFKDWWEFLPDEP